MKYVLSVVLTLLVASAGSTFAQVSDSHTVTVTVPTIHLLDIDQNVTLTAVAPTAGQDFAQVINRDSTIYWTTNAQNRKIVVRTGGAQPLHNLSVAADNRTAGTSAGTVALSGTDQDFLVEVGKTFGSAVLQYSIDPTVATDPGSTSYVIFYTMTGE